MNNIIRRPLPRTNCPVEKERHLRSMWMAPAKAQLVRGKTAGSVSFVFLLIVPSADYIISYEFSLKVAHRKSNYTINPVNYI